MEEEDEEGKAVSELDAEWTGSKGSKRLCATSRAGVLCFLTRMCSLTRMRSLICVWGAVFSY